MKVGLGLHSFDQVAAAVIALKQTLAFAVTSKIRVRDHYSIVAADDAVDFLPLGLDLAAAAAAATTLEPD